ncbi:unnamed protein product [Rhizoctonia solani]|uniref:Uncharacterized protein n=1 Tax=Rhizoctonia solani TaxID=456999 RepID=A0A8H3DG20_9AGAM|nr:unnamed protein product [Rhizoctonia solani]
MDVEPSSRVANRSEIDTENPVRPYHILVDYETDVLAYACALMQNSNKTICYTQHSVSALPLYETLFRAVNPKSVYTIENTTQEELDRAYSSFFSADNSVLLLPETIYSNIELPGSGSWVIHVGWPVDMLNYIQHIQGHKAFNNVFIAHSDDSRNRDSVADLMRQSSPWPGNLDPIREAASVLRPTLKQSLLEAPIELKENAYLDYIACHGPHGHRNCSWEAKLLAYHANLYLLDVLQYMNPENDGTEEIEMMLLLPEISPEFVTRHGLEQAVRDGVIRIKEVDSGLNHLSTLPEEYGAAAESETDIDALDEHLPQLRPPQEVHSTSSDLLDPKLQSEGAGTSRPLSSPEIMPTESQLQGQGPSLEFNPWAPSTDNTQPPAGSCSIMSQSTLVREYLIIEAEFDIIPTVCHLARQGSVSRTICFVKCLNAIEALIESMKKIVPKPIHVVRVGSLTKPVKKALQSGSECLVFSDMYYYVNPELSNEGFDSVIHVGWPDNDNVYTNHTQLRELDTSHVILSRKELNENGPLIFPELQRAGVLPIDPATKRDFNRQTELSTISSERALWRETLASVVSAMHVRSYYMAWIIHHYSGIHKKQEWTSIDVVNNANRHVKEVLLHGYGRQGNPVRGRPAVTAGYVAHFKLEDAVVAGILNARG